MKKHIAIIGGIVLILGGAWLYAASNASDRVISGPEDLTKRDIRKMQKEASARIPDFDALNAALATGDEYLQEYWVTELESNEGVIYKYTVTGGWDKSTYAVLQANPDDTYTLLYAGEEPPSCGVAAEMAVPAAVEPKCFADDTGELVRRKEVVVE